MTNIQQLALENRVEALEKALAVQDSVHKLTLSAIKKNLMNLLEDLEEIE